MPQFLTSQTLLPHSNGDIRIHLEREVRVDKPRQKLIKLTQYLFPPAEQTYLLPAGYLSVNDADYVLRLNEDRVVKHRSDVISILNDLIKTHNEWYKQTYKLKIAEQATLHYIRMAQLKRTILITKRLTDDPQQYDPGTRLATWETMKREGVVPQWVTSHLAAEEESLKINASTFQELRPDPEDTKKLLFGVRPLQKIEFCPQWARMINEGRPIHRPDVHLDYPLSNRRIDFNISALAPLDEVDWYCFCDSVEPTAVNSHNLFLLDIIKASQKTRWRREELDDNLGRCQHAYLRVGVHNHIDLSFREPGGAEVTFQGGPIFLKISVEENDNQ